MGMYLCKKGLLVSFEIREGEVLKNITKAPLNANPDLGHMLVEKCLLMRDTGCVEWLLHNIT